MSEVTETRKTKTNKQTKPKEKKRLSRSALILIIGIIIIAIPVIIFLSILGIAALQTGSPREGSRFDNDLVPEIKSSDVKDLQSEISSMGSVESCEVIESQGQLKIYVDVADSLSESEVDSMLTSIYNKVNNKLPINTYFTSTDSAKMYDLHIHVYTTAEASEIEASSSRQYKLLHKNAAEAEYSIDDLAHPKNPQLAAELEGRVEEPTDVEAIEAEDVEVEDDSQ